MEWLPTVSDVVVKAAPPPEMTAEPMIAPESMNLTVPVAAKALLLPVMFAVKVTALPFVEPPSTTDCGEAVKVAVDARLVTDTGALPLLGP